MKPPLEVTFNRPVQPHLHLCRVMRTAVEEAERCERDGPQDQVKHHATVAIVFCAFTLEAYMNYLGHHRLGDGWEDHLYDKHSRKLELLAAEIGMPLDRSRRPFNAYREVFNFRDEMAHGKVEQVKSHKPVRTRLPVTPRPPQANWERVANARDARRLFEATLGMLDALDRAAGLGGNPCERRWTYVDGFIGFPTES